ncbi:hypothetical protein HMPREF9413_3763 [Paenibacillus sp. HGF7]|nr:hypothetical protein HMPREF9413_3763 [Paenibacillus sp. HGF7]
MAGEGLREKHRRGYRRTAGTTEEQPGDYRRTAGQPTAGGILQPEGPVRDLERVRPAAGLLFQTLPRKRINR